MNKKFKRTQYPKHMVIERVRRVILDFLDKHEATIEAEDMTSEFWKQQMADALAEDLIDKGVSIGYLKVAKDERQRE